MQPVALVSTEVEGAPVPVMARINDAKWSKIIEDLRKPFAAWEIKFRVQGGEILAYVSRDSVVRRLNQVIGAGNWTFDPEVLVQDAKAVRVVKGYLTIFGVTKASLGDAGGEVEPSKTADSDSLKRVGMVFEIGAHLNYLAIDRVSPRVRIVTGEKGAKWVHRDDVARLRKLYAEGKLWECPEVAEYYGASYTPMPSGADDGDDRETLRDESVDEIAEAALAEASDEIAAAREEERAAYEKAVTDVTAKARNVGANQAQIDWIIAQSGGEVERLGQKLAVVVKAINDRKRATANAAKGAAKGAKVPATAGAR